MKVRRHTVSSQWYTNKGSSPPETTLFTLASSQLQDPDSLAAFEAFDSSKDVSSLVEAIKTILQE